MPLPTTNLSVHGDASVDTNLWQFYQAGTPFHNTPAVDNAAIQTWDDADGKDLSFEFVVVGAEPNWRSGTPLMVAPCLDFNGTTDFLELYNIAGTANVALLSGNIISAGAFVFLASLYVEGVTTNDADPYDNDAVFSDNTGVWGVHFRNNAGACSIVGYNFDGSVDEVSLSLSLNTSYVFAYWHTGGSIFTELYTTAGLVASGNTASGDTTSGAGQLVRIGKSWDTANAFYNGRLGEYAIYNAHDATDRAAATQYFRDKWVPAPAAGTKFLLNRP